MLYLLNELIVPLTFLYIVPLVFGLWFINTQATMRNIKERWIWIIFLFFVPILALIIFYLTQIRGKRR